MRDFGYEFQKIWGDLLRDTPVLALLFMGSVLYAWYYPAAYKAEVVAATPIAIVDLDHSRLSREIIRAADALQNVDIVLTPSDLLAARQALEAQQIYGILLIPERLEEKLLKAEKPTLLLYSDASYMARNAAILNSLSSMLTELTQQISLSRANRHAGIASPLLLQSAQSLDLVVRPVFNTREGYGSYLVPPVAVLIGHQLIVLACALVSPRLWQYRRPTGTTLMASWVLFSLLAMLLFSFYTAFVYWWHDYPRGGETANLLLSLPLFAASVTAFALFIGSFFPNRERATQIISLSSVPLFFLSGIPWPASLIPPLLQWISWLFPITPGLHLMLKINQMGASLSQVLPELLHLSALLLMYGLLCRWRLANYRNPAVALEHS